MLPMDAGRHVLGGAGFDFLSCPLRPDCRETVPVRGVALAVHAVLQHLEGVDGGVTGPPPRPRLYSCLGDVDVASREISKREPERAKGGIRSAVASYSPARLLRPSSRHAPGPLRGEPRSRSSAGNPGLRTSVPERRGFIRFARGHGP
jgi:hypothetical protein